LSAVSRWYETGYSILLECSSAIVVFFRVQLEIASSFARISTRERERRSPFAMSFLQRILFESRMALTAVGHMTNPGDTGNDKAQLIESIGSKVTCESS
jgi:hypothetical protein